MHILIAEDDEFSRLLLEAHLEKFGHSFRTLHGGDSAIQAFKSDPEIEMAILDWMMPDCDGLQVCRSIKAETDRPFTYVMMLTVKREPEEIAEALDAGADDFITKPFNAVELRARTDAGGRIVRLQRALAKTIGELQTALGQVEQLKGILPICAWCKRIRDDANYWTRVEDYIRLHSQAEFTHSICPDCMQKLYPGPDGVDQIV